MPVTARVMPLRFVGMRISRQAYIIVDFLKKQTGNMKRKEFINTACNINHHINNIRDILIEHVHRINTHFLKCATLDEK